MVDFVVFFVINTVLFFAGYIIGRKRSSASAGASPTREHGAITQPAPADADQGAIYGYGVWHSEDGEWIGFAATSSMAAELVPEGSEYGHLWLRPVVAHVLANDLTSEEPDA